MKTQLTNTVLAIGLTLARISHSHLASLADRAIYRHDRSGSAIIG